jgi:hypothetical protein
MSKNDRGEHVRRPEEFLALARGAFGDVNGEVVSGLTRIPSSFWLMRMSGPRVAGGLVSATVSESAES